MSGEYRTYKHVPVTPHLILHRIAACSTAHTQKNLTHRQRRRRVLYWPGSKRFECTHRRPTDRPAIQSQYIDWLLIWFLAFDILNGSCFVFIHLVFQTPKLQRVWTASTYSLHTLSIESKIRTTYLAKCVYNLYTLNEITCNMHLMHCAHTIVFT